MTDTFMPDKPCRNGHTSPRYSSNRRCVQCTKDKSGRAYAKHADTYKTRASQWHADNREHNLQRMRGYHGRVKDDAAYQQRRADYHETHRNRLNALRNARNALPDARAAKAQIKRDLRHIYTAYEHKRRAQALRAVPAWFGEFDNFVMNESIELCRLRAKATGVEWHLDHMIPLLARAACGLHCAANVQVIPERLNRRKNNKLVLTEPLEWLRHL